jgi:hypothetical protein
MKKIIKAAVIVAISVAALNANAQSSGLGGACNTMVESAYKMKQQGVSQATVKATFTDIINKKLPQRAHAETKKLANSIVEATYKGASVRDMKSICNSI